MRVVGGPTVNSKLPSYLWDEQQRIEAVAREFGLDFFPVIFEVLPYYRMSEIAAYGGFPIRYPHWRFGMEYERLAKSQEYGLSKIYELVINNNPAIAYLLEGNSLVDQKLVMCHVLAHVDFFKHNYAFRATDQGRDPMTGEPIRKWIDTMANHGSIVRKWAGRVGGERVEEFLDLCLRLENLIDPNLPFTPKAQKKEETDEVETPPEIPRLPVQHEYMERYINPDEFIEAQKRKLEAERELEKRFPYEATRDVLGFLIEHVKLEQWQRELLEIVRREAYYFLPQAETKIMNEGWASYWHSRLMTERVLDSSEIVDYAERNASVMQTSPAQLNPYKLGVELFRHIEERWDRGQFGKEWDECDDYVARQHWDRRTGLGRKKIFEVRALYKDVTFIDEFLTPEFVADQKLYTFGYNRRSDRYEVESRVFHDVKQKLIDQLTNGGNPVIRVVDANHGNRGELLLVHDHRGIDLRYDWAKEALEALTLIWSRPVELHTVQDDKAVALRFDGTDHSRSLL